jgi:hypothetical protein
LQRDKLRNPARGFRGFRRQRQNLGAPEAEGHERGGFLTLARAVELHVAAKHARE